MRDAVQTERAGPGEDARELLRRVAALAAVETDANAVLAIRQRLVERRDRLVFAQVAQEAQDQRAGHPELAPRPLACRGEAANDGADRHAARGVRLRIEEDLGVDDVVGRGALEIGAGEVAEILLADEDVRALVIDIQKILQITEIIGLSDLVDRTERN